MRYTWSWESGSGGTFLKNGKAVNSFTQAEVNAGAISFKASPSPNHSLNVSVTDSHGASNGWTLPLFDVAALTPFGGSSQWFDGSPSDGITISYTFLQSVPSYYLGNANERNGFTPFSEAQKAVTREILNNISQFLKVSFVETVDVHQSQLTFASIVHEADTGAYAYFPKGKDASRFTTNGDIWFNVDYLYTPLTAGSFEAASLIHEIGHALGLPHPYPEGGSDDGDSPHYDVRHSVMSYNGFPDAEDAIAISGISPESYMMDDIARLRQLYGATPKNTSDSTYTFAQIGAKVLTLIDDGGHDAIDLRDAPYGISIDLSPGGLSTVWNNAAEDVAVDGNIGIAYDAVIEDAIGSPYDDYLFGNQAANVLAGGYGDDLLYPVTVPDDGIDYVFGGPGDDTIWLDSVDNVYLEGGDGQDKLHFAGAYLNLAEITPDPETPTSIEVVDLSDPQAQELTINAVAILDFGGGGASGNALQILGQSNDKVRIISGSYTKSIAHVNDDGIQLTLWHDAHNAQGDLLIQTGVQVDIVFP